MHYSYKSNRKLPEQITATWLRRQGACSGQRDLFKAVFPKGAKVTMRNLLKALNRGVDVNWLLDYFPDETLRAYHKAIDSANSKYYRAVNAAHKVANWDKREAAVTKAVKDLNKAEMKAIAEGYRQTVRLRAKQAREKSK